MHNPPSVDNLLEVGEQRRVRPAGRVPGFDGIRAIAILSVIALHTGQRFAKGGGVGVDIFFVLSGYLITSLLVAEYEKTRAIRLGAFYARRFVRLMPALLVMVVVILLLSRLLDESTLPRGQTLAGAALSVTYTSDIAISFFNAHLGPFFHTWTLGLEEYYYLIWPLFLLLMLRRGCSRRRIAQVTIIPIAMIAVLRIATWFSLHSAIHSMYGFDVRSDQLLIGSTLGLLTPHLLGQLRAARRESLLTWLGWAGAIVVAGVVLVGPPLTFLVIAGYWLNATAAAAIILCVAGAPGSTLSRILSLAPVAYVGRISYSLYLWDVPLDEVFIPARSGSLPHPVVIVIHYSTILIAAILSHHLVELPLQQMLRCRQRDAGVAPPALTTLVASDVGAGANWTT
jgi:peptidoglycan/LPS O-acetylase OafA/YrhL